MKNFQCNNLEDVVNAYDNEIKEYDGLYVKLKDAVCIVKYSQEDDKYEVFVTKFDTSFTESDVKEINILLEKTVKDFLCFNDNEVAEGAE